MRERELRIALEGFTQQAKSALAVFPRIARSAPSEQISRAQEKLIGREVGGRMHLQTLFLPWRKVRAQRKGDPTGQFTLEREKIGDLAIVGVVPNVQVGPGIDQLSVDAHPIAGPSHRAFQDVSDPELLADLPQIARARPVLPNRSSADHLEVGDLRKTGENIVLDAVREVHVLQIVAKIFERQDGDAFLRRVNRSCLN